MITLNNETANIVRAALCFTSDQYRAMVIRTTKIRDDLVHDVVQGREDACTKAIAMLPRIDGSDAAIVGLAMNAYVRELGRIAALNSARGNMEGASLGESRQREVYAAISVIANGGATNAC